jgi:hypothetical protein
MEILGSPAKSLSHLSAAEIALTSWTATRVLTALKTLDSGLQRVLTAAGYELRNQGLEPVRSVSQQLSTRSARRVEGGITGAQQRQAPVAGRFGVREREQRLSQCAVGSRLVSHHRV